MATVDSIIAAGKGSAGSNGSWRVVGDGDTLELWHYSHRMLVWDRREPSNPEVLDYSIGWGSVSDQGGMNRAFRALGLPLRYDRAGGAEIVDITELLAERRAR